MQLTRKLIRPRLNHDPLAVSAISPCVQRIMNLLKSLDKLAEANEWKRWLQPAKTVVRRQCRSTELVSGPHTDIYLHLFPNRRGSAMKDAKTVSNLRPKLQTANSGALGALQPLCKE